MMDSDCDLASDAVDNAVKIFYTDRRIGAVTGHARVRGAAEGNTLLKIEDVWFDGQFRMLKGMETSFSSLTCCSGALSIYRREAVHQYIHAWAHDHFLGIDNFKFATDRRLTAYVLGAKPEDIWEARRTGTGEQDSNKNSIDYNNIPILQTGKDDLNAMRSSSDPDQEEPKKKDRRKYAWRLVLQSERKGDSRSARYSRGTNTTTNPLEEELHSEPSRNWRNILAKAILRSFSILSSLGPQTYETIHCY